MLSYVILLIILIMQRPPVERVEELQTRTRESADFTPTEVTVSVAVLLTATEDTSGNLTVSEYNNVICSIMMMTLFTVN